MSETQEKLELTVALAKHDGDTPSGYKKYTIVASDGENYNVKFPPRSKIDPKKGDTLLFYKGRYGGWLIDEMAMSTDDEPSNAKSSYKGGSKTKSEYELRQEYWDGKTKRDIAYQEYTMEETNPKIEFQSYMGFVKDFYIAAIPNLKKPPATTQDIDAYMDDAYAKAEAIYIRRQKAFEKKKEKE